MAEYMFPNVAYRATVYRTGSFNHFMDFFGGICLGNIVEHEQEWCVLSTPFVVAFCLPILI